MAEERAASRSRSPVRKQNEHMSVGDVVRDASVCSHDLTLDDAVAAMIASARTAVVVIEDEGVCGVITENDILAALVESTQPDAQINTWLQGGIARLPKSALPSFTLKSDAPLQKASKLMSAEAENNAGFACHHVLVCDGDNDARGPRLLSALDVAHAIICADKESEEVQAAKMSVKEAMKKSSDVVTCKSSDKLEDAFRLMYAKKQNAILVVGSPADPGETPEDLGTGDEDIHGIVTAADAFRIFSEYQHGDTTTVGRFLHGLTEAEHATTRKRSINSDASLADAAEIMVFHGIHHLVVRGDDGKHIIGTLSALDIVRAISSLGD